MLCSCKHVDDVVIGAPFVITEDLLRCLNIKKVISVINTEEDAV
jgi:glycerol-3-phosphate cytidylyltransferase-like family protein